MNIPVITPDGKQAVFKRMDDFSHIMAVNRKIELFTSHEQYYNLINLVGDLEKAVAGRNFILVNQNILVNKNSIIRFDRFNKTLIFRSGDVILKTPVSVRNIAKLNAFMKTRDMP